MSGNLLHQNALINCIHSGTATPVAVVPQVMVNGFPVITLIDSMVVVGCQNPVKTGGQACQTAQWVPGTAATRVFAAGMPILLGTSQATCYPTNTGLNILTTQQRVKGL